MSSTAASAPAQKVLFQSHTPSVLEMKLNAPKALNSVDTEMCNLMIDQLQKWHQAKDTTPRVCLMSGVGGKAFCAGGDIVSIYHAKVNGKGNLNIPAEFFAREYLLDYNLS